MEGSGIFRDTRNTRPGTQRTSEQHILNRQRPSAIPKPQDTEALKTPESQGLLVKPDPWDWPLTLAGMELWPFGVHRILAFGVWISGA